MIFSTYFTFLQDQNDFKPKFGREEYTARLLENVAMGTGVVEVKATDGDPQVNKRLHYIW